MANTFNKTIIIGRLGCEPELKQGPKSEYTRFSLSNSSVHEGQEEVQWHMICAFGKQARLCSEHLHKGDLCCIEGHLDNRSYMKNGEKAYSQSIIAEKVTFLASKRRAPAANEVVVSNVLEEAFPA